MRITLYIRRMADIYTDIAFRFVREANKQINTLYWTEHTFGYAISGNVEKQPLLQLAHTARFQLIQMD